MAADILHHAPKKFQGRRLLFVAEASDDSPLTREEHRWRGEEIRIARVDDGRQHSSGGLDGGPIITFVPSQTGPISVVVDQVGGGATTLYWLNHARRWRRTGTLAEAVLASPSMFLASGLKQPVYWTNTAEGGVSKVGSNGGAPFQLASGPAFGVAVDDANVYWTSQTARVPRPGPHAPAGRS